MRFILLLIIMSSVLLSCSENNLEVNLDVDKELDYCQEQIYKTLYDTDGKGMASHSILCNPDHRILQTLNRTESSIGFWMGILWYNYENTHRSSDADAATYYTNKLESLTLIPTSCNDFEFQLFCSYGNAYRLTKNKIYKQIILNVADTIATRFNSSYAHQGNRGQNISFNSVLDDMVNLEILYWASKNGGDTKFAEIATKYAETIMSNYFRKDGSYYHVVLYNTETENFIKRDTNQNCTDNNLSARRQAWAIYVYTFVYRETQDKKFLRFAEKITDLYLSKLPKDEYIPYWNFYAPAIPYVPKDVSAAAIVASALLELSQLVYDHPKAQEYKTVATNTIVKLSSYKYDSNGSVSSSFRSTTLYSLDSSKIDVSTNCADYFYIEALIRYKKIQQGLTITDNLM